MSRLFGALSGVLLLLYPFGVYFGVQIVGPRAIGALLLVLFGVRYYLSKKHSKSFRSNFFPAAAALGIGFCVLVLAVGQADLLKYYPVLVNIFFLALFATSLRHPPPIIERVARIHHPDLPPRGIVHARQVTFVWCGFFVLNGGVALYTALFSDMKTWTLYNGFLSYLAMGVLFLLEWLVRRARMAQDKREAAELC